MPTSESNFSRYIIPDPVAPTGSCCICVNVPDSPQYRAQFLGAIWRMSLQTHYERDDAHSAVLVAARWREVFHELVDNGMNCCGKTLAEKAQDIRISQTNILQLQQTIHQQWIDASLDVQVAYYNVPDDFDTDPGDTGDEVADRNRALCLAVGGFVDELMNQGMSALEGAVPELVAVLTGTTLLPFVGMPVSAVLGGFALGFGIGSYIQLADEDYRKYITCAMFENLQGISTGDRDSFNESLDTFPNPRPTPETGDEDFVRDAIEVWLRSQLNNLDNYLVFVAYLGFSMDIAGQLTDQDCDCLGWIHSFDFTEENDGWTTRAEDSRDHGTYVANVGWVSEYDVGVEKLYIQRKWAVSTIIKTIRVMYNSTGSGGTSPSMCLTLEDGDVDQDFVCTPLFTTPGEFQHKWQMSETADEIDQSIVLHTPSDTHSITIMRIVVSGLGTDPFL